MTFGQEMNLSSNIATEWSEYRLNDQETAE